MKTKTTRGLSEIPADYAALIAMLPLRPMHDQVDVDNATEVIDAMAGHELNGDQEDYLDVLSTLVDNFEAEHEPAIMPSKKRGLANLRQLMEEHGMTASDLGRLFGNRAVGSKILRGERALNLTHIKKLMKHFAVDSTAFL